MAAASKDRHQRPFNPVGLPIISSFCGRSTELAYLAQTLLPNSSKPGVGSGVRRRQVLLHGISGIGKTRLGLEFVRTQEQHFTAIIWLHGGSSDRLKHGLCQYYQRSLSPSSLGESSSQSTTEDDILIPAGTFIEETMQKCVDWLQEAGNTNWLLVIDNFDLPLLSPQSSTGPEPFDIRKLLPKCNHGSVLLISRSIMQWLDERLHLERFDPKTALEMLNICHYRQHVHKKSDRELIQLIGTIPLVVSLTGSCLAKKDNNLSLYISYYREHLASVESWIQSIDSRFRYAAPDHAIIAAISTSIQMGLFTLGDESLLYFWSFLDANDFSFQLVERAAQIASTRRAVRERVSHMVDDRKAFDKAIYKLWDFRFVTPLDESDGWTLHNAIHWWAYFKQGDRRQLDLGLLAATLPGYTVIDLLRPRTKYSQWRVFPHSEAVYRLVVSDSRSQTESALSLETVDEVQDVSTAMFNLGRLYFTINKFDISEKFFLKALGGWGQTVGYENILVIQSWLCLGHIYYVTDRRSDALDLYQKVFQATELIDWRRPPMVATLQLGDTYSVLGEYQEAEKMYRICLELFDSSTDMMLPNAAYIGIFCEIKIGDVLAYSTKKIEAKAIYSKALTRVQALHDTEMSQFSKIEESIEQRINNLSNDAESPQTISIKPFGDYGNKINLYQCLGDLDREMWYAITEPTTSDKSALSLLQLIPTIWEPDRRLQMAFERAAAEAGTITYTTTVPATFQIDSGPGSSTSRTIPGVIEAKWTITNAPDNANQANQATPTPEQKDKSKSSGLRGLFSKMKKK